MTTYIPYIEPETIGTERLAEHVQDLYRRIAELEKRDRLEAEWRRVDPEGVAALEQSAARVADTSVTLRVPVEVISEIRRVLDRMGEVDASGGPLVRKNAVHLHLGRELRAAVIRLGIPS